MSKRMYNSLDVGRMLMALCVVVIHTSSLTFTNIIADRIYSNFLSMAVPYFFLVSGFLYFSRLEKISKDSEKQIAVRYIKIMFRRYCVWSLIYLPVAVYEYIQYGTGWKGVLIYIKDFFLVGGHYFSLHFWFILSSIYGILLIMILRRKLKEEYILCIAIVCAAGVSFYQIVLSHPEWMSESLYGLLLWVWERVSINKLYAGFVYLSISMCLVKWKRELPLMISILLLIVTFWLEAWGHSVVLHYVAEILFFECVRGIRLPDHKCYIFLRRTSAVIYYSHMMFVFMWGMVKGIGYGRAEYRGLDYFLFAMAMTVLVSVVLNWFLYRNIGEKYIKLLL